MMGQYMPDMAAPHLLTLRWTHTNWQHMFAMVLYHVTTCACMLIALAYLLESTLLELRVELWLSSMGSAGSHGELCSQCWSV